MPTTARTSPPLLRERHHKDVMKEEEKQHREEQVMEPKVLQPKRGPKPHRFVAGSSTLDTDEHGEVGRNLFRGFVNLCNFYSFRLLL